MTGLTFGGSTFLLGITSYSIALCRHPYSQVTTMIDTLSHYLRDGTEVWANCETRGCAHGAPLDLQVLLKHQRVGDVTVLALADLGLIRCRECGNKEVHLNIHPRHQLF